MSDRPFAFPISFPEEELDACLSCHTKNSARNLVVCIDGTSNQFSKTNTNVVELYSRLEKSKRQLTFYNSGIGTYAKPSWRSWSYYSQIIANKLDLAFALRFEKIMLSAYAWLVDNYEEGDRIFLFGFSRGAYQVRALSAMIDTVGLLHKGNDDQIPFAYELYAASDDDGSIFPWMEDQSSKWQGARFLLARVKPVADLFLNIVKRVQSLSNRFLSALRGRLVPSNPGIRIVPRNGPSPSDISEHTDHDYQSQQSRFRRAFSRDIKVHFVGAWDTVSSVGVIRNKTLPMTTDGMIHVCRFRHALALHEYRVKFLPEYACGGEGPRRAGPHTKEVWFAGSHSDIGGGSSTNTTLDKFGPALRWMSLEATTAGLRLESGPVKWGTVQLSSSMTPLWRLVECLPIKRLAYRGNNSVTRWPHLCRERSVKPLQGIHQTVYEDYDVQSQSEDVYMELDEWTTAGQLLISDPEEYWKDGEMLRQSDIDKLQLLFKSDTGYQSLVDRQISHHIDQLALLCWRRRHEAPAARHALNGLHILQTAVRNRSYHPDQFETMLLSTALGIADTGRPESFPFGLCGDTHRDPVNSAIFASSDLVLSASDDRTLRLWETHSGDILDTVITVGRPNSVAAYLQEGLIAAGCADGSVQTWKLAGGRITSTGVVMRQAKDSPISSVAFSPDGTRIVSAGVFGSLQLWNVVTGAQEGQTMHHEAHVYSVAFLGDGTRIVSGSDCVRIWDARTFQPVGDPLPGSTGFVHSVACSLDGKSIAASCLDTVRIWDAATLELKFTLGDGPSMDGPVAFSPCAPYCALCTPGNRIYIWNTNSGQAVGVLNGHPQGINSVAWSPDGTRIVSASNDGTVRVWDRISVADLLPK